MKHMKKIFFSILTFSFLVAGAQENVLPADKQKQPIAITGATVHVGNGQVLNNATVIMVDGKITAVGTNVAIPAGAQKIDATGKHVYPGLILASSNLGLVDIANIRASNDVRELGDMNPNVRSIVAYNTDSKIINTLRSNGILMANIVPDGSLVAGSSSVVQLDAWNWEDAAYNTDAGMHIYMPSMMPRARFGGFGGGGGGGPQQPQSDPVKEGLDQVEKIKGLFREAKAYLAETK